MEEIPLGFWTANATRLCELNRLGSRTEECESHVSEAEEEQPDPEIQSTAGHVKPGGKMGGPPSKPKYYPVTDSETVL